MRKLMVIAVTLSLLVAAARFAAVQAGGSQTQASGPVSSNTLAFLFSPVFLGLIPGLPIGDQVRVEWEPIVGGNGEVRDETNGTSAQCTVVANTTPSPSNRLRYTVNQSNINGINMGDTLQVTVNFSSTSAAFSAPGLLGSPFTVVILNPNEVCIKNITTSTGVDLQIAQIGAK
jgi:hypothetical protein